MIFGGVAAVCAVGFYLVGQGNLERRYVPLFLSPLFLPFNPSFNPSFEPRAESRAERKLILAYLCVVNSKGKKHGPVSTSFR